MLSLLHHPSAMLGLMATLFCIHLAAADYALNDPPTDMKISRDGSVYVSAGETLIYLNADLSENASVSTIGGRIAHAYNDTDIFMACTEEVCSMYYIYWPDSEVDISKRVIQGSSSTTLVSVQLENQFYVGATDNEDIILKQFDPHSPDPQLRVFDQSIVNENFYRRQFLYAFESEDYVYFLVRDNGTNDLTTNMRVMRVCQEEGGTDYHFVAVYEAILECGDFSASSQVTVSESVVEMEVVGKATIIAITTNSKTNICIFSIGNIDMEMDMSYSECVSGDNNERTIPLVWYNDRTCGHFGVGTSQRCNFDILNTQQEVPALAAFDSIVGENILQFNESDEITAILAFKVDSTDLLLVAYSKNEEHFLAKYHIRSTTDVQLVSREQVDHQVILLRWSELWEQIYGATLERVFDIPLENCSHFTTCSSCTSGADPVCGWCVLENTCSRQIYCRSGSKPGHWVQDEEQCIASISLDPPSIAVDYVHNVELTIIPPTAALPSSPPGEYMCSFYDENSSYNITTPYVDGECQILHTEIPSFTGTHMDLKFVLTVNGTPTDHVLGSSTLTLHNCTQLSTCAECVEASISCGWCVYDHICTGKSSICQDEEQWQSLANINQEEGMSVMASHEVCPTVLTPDHGVYTHPVMVGRDLNLSTLNMPPEISGFHYGCQLEYGNNTVQLSSTYHNETLITCGVSENQVQLSRDVVNGWETTHLTLQWVREMDEYAISIGTQTVNLYDCMQLGSDCSSCFSANIGSGFECIWCDYTFMADECTVTEYCQRDSTLIKNISGCPKPLINSISPMSGPTDGGTVLTLNGSNLGALAANVTVELVHTTLNETIPCLVDESLYIPGRQIVCTTQRGTEGEYNIVVKDDRKYIGSRSSEYRDTFHYVVVIINEIVPLLGPKAGGTEIVLRGTGLDISSPQHLGVSIGEVECTIRSVGAEEIRCISQRAPSAGIRRVRVTIDNARIATYEYSYTENPVFTRVEPQNIIPAGGTTLTFRGRYLNVVLNPLLSLTVNNYTRKSICRPKSSFLLICIAPRLSDVTFDSEHVARRNTDNNIQVSYTVVMDGADGPSSTDDNLKLVVKPNPVFTAIHEEDTEYTIDSKTTIRILGVNIDSVVEEEISAFVDEDECALAEISAAEIRCWPPDTAEPGDKEVKVIIANNSLNYSVGLLRYRTTSTSSSDNNIDIIVVILPVIAGVIVLLLTCLAILIGAIALAIRRRKLLKASKRAHNFGHEGKELQLMAANPNVYNRRYGGSSHDYDTIPDVLAEMQMACNTSEGTEFTIVPTCSSNLYSSEDEGKGSSTGSHSRPNSSSTSGSVSGKYTKTAPLPAVPVSTSDEYVAMGSFSVSDTVSSVGKGQSAANNVDTSHQPSTEAVSATTAASRQEKALGDAPFSGVRLNGTEETNLKATEDSNASQESSA